jgi:two-component system, OmpR family, sensor histidine kinase SenX3
MVSGDVSALKSALRNLISNAVKYGGDSRWLRVAASIDTGTSPAGRAHTVIQLRERRRVGPAVIFTVEDHGIGIDADDRRRVFDPFYRGREAVAQQIQGSGLGLNLVTRIVAAHGGRLAMWSEPGKGSTFALSVPAVEVHDRGLTEDESINLARQATPSR